MRRRRLGHAGWGWTAFAGVVSFIYFFPVLWIVLTAFKAHTDALAIPPKWIFTPTLENFVSVFARAYIKGQTAVDTNFDVYFFNSIFIAGSSVLIALIIGTLAAYGFSRYPLRGNNTYLFIILTTRMLPPIVVIIPIFLMFRVSGLSGTYAGVILLYTAFNLPFTIWMMKSFFDELSPEVEDAARLDGSNGYRVFFRICMPQVKAGLAATAVFGPHPHLERVPLRPPPHRGRDPHRPGCDGTDHRWRHRGAVGAAGGHRDPVPDPRRGGGLRPPEPPPARGHLRDHPALGRRDRGREEPSRVMSTIRLRNVTKRFGSLVAVNRADLDVEAGEVLCLLGPSGCGKTTTLRMIAGLEDATEGDILIAEQAGQPPPPVAARHRDGVSVLCPLPRPHGGREPRLPRSTTSGSRRRRSRRG